MMARKLAAG
jgi:hypothetical protein